MISSPGVPAGTRNIDVPLYTDTSGSVTAMTMMNDARSKLDENHFSPSMTHESPSRTARVVNSEGSEPPCGSVIE
jgi:hypothetical protein